MTRGVRLPTWHVSFDAGLIEPALLSARVDTVTLVVTAGARRASASILGMEGFPPRDVAGARAVAGARL